MSSRHQANRRRQYGPRRHELLERRERVADAPRFERDERPDVYDLDIAVAFRPMALPPTLPTMGD